MIVNHQIAAIPCTPTATVNVGRLRSHPSGRGFRVYPDAANEPDTYIDGEGGKGLTISEAREVLDWLDANKANRSSGQ